jgi:ribose transport system substrate-binding protein
LKVTFVRTSRATLAVASSLIIVACGAQAPGAAQNDPNRETKSLSFFEERLDVLRSGSTYSSPPTDGPAPQLGKRIWGVIYGLGTSASDDAARGLQQAGRDIGWDVRIFDGQFSANRYAEGINQAIADRADGIYLYVVDCALVQNALQQAKAAGIPVVAGESLDCNEVAGDGPRLFTSDIGPYNGGPYFTEKIGYKDWVASFGRSQAVSIIGATGGKAKVIDFYWTDSESTRLQEIGFRSELSLCAECEVVDTVEFTAADLGPSLRAKADQALLRNPDANAVMGVYDAAVTGGIGPAVVASGRGDQIFVAGGEGTPPNVELVREGIGQNSGVVSPVQWESYAAMDAFNQIFHGAGAPRPTGIGVLVWDADHNMPTSPGLVQVPIDYRQAYLKAWGK